MRALYLSGCWSMVVEFGSLDEYNAWHEEVMEIKDHMATINDDGEPGASRNSKYRGWLNRVKDDFNNNLYRLECSSEG